MRRARQYEIPGHMPMTDGERQVLWQDYLAGRDPFLRNTLVVEYMPVVKYLAEMINVRLPESVMVEDLISYGTFGLIDAIESFDIERGVKFETFCAPRIRGAILDGLRAQDWVPRITRSRMRQLRRTREALENELGRPPTETELAKRLGLDHKQMHELMNEVSSVTIFSLSDSTGDPDDSALRNIDYVEDCAAADPMETLQKREILEVAKRCLSEKEFIVLDGYYNRELTMRDIGDGLGMSESRVSQIHSKAIKRLHFYITKGDKVHA